MHVTSTTFLQILVPLLRVVYRDCFSATFAIYRSSCRLSSVTATSTPLRIVLVDSSIRRDRAFFFFFFIIFPFFHSGCDAQTATGRSYLTSSSSPIYNFLSVPPPPQCFPLLPLIFKGSADDSVQFISTVKRLSKIRIFVSLVYHLTINLATIVKKKKRKRKRKRKERDDRSCGLRLGRCVNCFENDGIATWKRSGCISMQPISTRGIRIPRGWFILSR